MDYTEIIEREAEDAAENSKLDAHEVKPFIDGFINGLKSDLAKQITEIEVASGKIELLKSLMIYLHSLPYNKKLADLEQLREQHEAEMVEFAEWIMNNVDDSFQSKDSYQWIVDSHYEPSIPTTDLLTLFKNRNK